MFSIGFELMHILGGLLKTGSEVISKKWDDITHDHVEIKCKDILVLVVTTVSVLSSPLGSWLIA